MEPPDTHTQTPRAVSPVPSCVSMKSDGSMWEPLNFSNGPPQSHPNGVTILVRRTQGQSWCGVCEQLLRDPVITTCGHSFCRQCISSYWSQSAPSGDYSCPQCRKSCRTQPVVNPDTTMAQPLLCPYDVVTQPYLYPNTTMAQPPVYPYTTMAQPFLYPNTTIAQPPVNPSAAMAQPSLYQHTEMAKAQLSPATAMAQSSPSPHTYMGQPHLHSKPHTGQPSVTEHTEGSSHVQSEEPPVKRAKLAAVSGGRTMSNNLSGSTFNGPVTFGDGSHVGCWQYSSRLSGEANRHTTGHSEGHIQLASLLSEHKEKMKARVEYIHEGGKKTKTQASIKKIYTELYITEGKTEEVNNEHEVWQIEATARAQTTEERAISCNDIFKPLPGQSKNIRTVLTMGIAGIGKTVSVKKFILDWSEGEANQDVGFMFMLPFRELNLVQGEKSLHELLCIFCPELKKLHDKSVYDEGKIVIIFDGLDEGKIELDFEKKIIASVTEVSTVDVLVTNIIRGKLLSSSHVWITSRPAAINQIPSDQFIDRVTEVRGFNDVQKEEYFHRTIDSKIHANQIVSHMKSSRTLYIMCYIPVFCLIVATVLQKMLKNNEKEMPKTITEMYIYFLLIQTQMKNLKYHGGNETNKQNLLDCHKDGILKLAQLAFKHLNNRSILFNTEDLEKCAIDVHDGSVYSGMFTGIFKEDSVFFEEKMFCFVHLSIQEFLAALHVFISYLNKNEEALAPFLRRKHRASPNSDLSLDELLKSAVNKALESKNGHLDLFVRFLHGISLESNQRLLLGLLTHTHSSPESVKKTIKNLKGMQRQNISPERCINLFHCLVEMHDSSVHDEIQAFLRAEKGSVKQLSLAHCSALAYVLLMSDEVLDEFDLNKYKTSPEGRRRLVPAVRCCRKARLAGCGLTETSCEIVASALQSANSPLRELDLSHNDLQKSGEKLLSALQSPHCKLETLRLAGCKLTEKQCEVVASAVQYMDSLTELDLSGNHMSITGVQLLNAGMSHPSCKLQILRLAGCKLTDESYEVVASALQSLVSLSELDLGHNHMSMRGVQLLHTALSHPNCRLQTLRLAGCKLTDESYEVVASALQSLVSLSELDLGDNHMSVRGVQLLHTALSHPNCRLQTLRLSPKSISVDGCVWLASALMSNPSCVKKLHMDSSSAEGSAQKLLLDTFKDPHRKVEAIRLASAKLGDGSCEIVAGVLQSENSLIELDLSDNELGDSGVEIVSKGLTSPHCKLQILRLVGCGVTEESGGILAFALQSVNSHLRELDLSKNTLGDCGGKLCSEALNPHCKLETLRLAGCKLTEKQCEVVASAVQYMDSLTELDLSDNHMSITGLQLLNAWMSHPSCKLQILRLAGCNLTERPCEVIASAVQSCVSLTELDLSDNYMSLSAIQLLNAGLGHLKLQMPRYRHGENGRIKPELREYA
ncbi:hypothetical protein ACEWY4_017398 [Coilia grayii]|uniref:NACHT, LRR and PYD domains-containing protein 12-like n=1 Tax=Coilia grayii TaxID=363190 RepID=A0ABD1JH12_9TELE